VAPLAARRRDEDLDWTEEDMVFVQATRWVLHLVVLGLNCRELLE
jgi:hypothetical protein